MTTHYYRAFEINLTDNPDAERGGVEWSLCDLLSGGDELDAGLAFSEPAALKEAKQAADRIVADSTPYE